MGIDYVITRKCPVKTSLAGSFLLMVKKQSRYEFFRQKFAKEPGFTDTTIFYDVYSGPLGVVREPTSLTMLRLELSELVQGGLYCFQCGANFRQCPGGCWGYIGFPIAGSVEKLLLVTAEAMIKNFLPGTAVLSSNYSGIVKDLLNPTFNGEAFFTAWRENGLTELAQPLQYKWGRFWQKRILSTDTIVTYLLGQDLKDAHLNNVAKFLNFFQSSVEAGIKEAIRNNPQVGDYELRIRSQLRDFIHYTKACQVAAEIGENLEIILPEVVTVGTGVI